MKLITAVMTAEEVYNHNINMIMTIIYILTYIQLKTTLTVRCNV